MLQNSGSSWRDRVRAKSAIVAIHLLSVISSIRLCVCRASRRGVKCTCTPISSGCLESCIHLWIVAHRECQDSLLPPTFWRQLAEIATGRRARCRICRFSPSASSSRRCVRRRRRRGGGSVQSLISCSTDGPVNPFVTGTHCWAYLLHVKVFFRCSGNARP